MLKDWPLRHSGERSHSELFAFPVLTWGCSVFPTNLEVVYYPWYHFYVTYSTRRKNAYGTDIACLRLRDRDSLYGQRQRILGESGASLFYGAVSEKQHRVEIHAPGGPKSKGKAERVIRTSMEMRHDKERFGAPEHRRKSLACFVNGYNQVKLHKALGNLMPDEKPCLYFFSQDFVNNF